MATKVFDLSVAEALLVGATTCACPHCGQSNWMKASPSVQTTKPGMLTVRCKTCTSKANSTCQKNRYANNKEWREAHKLYHNDRYANDLEHRKLCKTASSTYKKDRYATNEEYREAIKTKCLVWQKENPGKANAISARRRAMKLLATPPWSETDLIREFYVNCKPGMHVDHIIPLTSPTDENGDEIGCGLHVLKNLQYLPAAENLSKSNKWPESLVDWIYTEQ